MASLQSRLFIILMISTKLMAQNQSGENIITKPQYNVSSERFFTDESGTILMNVNVWGHVNRPGRHMVFDGIDIATLLSVVGGPKQGAKHPLVQTFSSRRRSRCCRSACAGPPSSPPVARPSSGTSWRRRPSSTPRR